jgi:hypothetical protein
MYAGQDRKKRRIAVLLNIVNEASQIKNGMTQNCLQGKRKNTKLPRL